MEERHVLCCEMFVDEVTLLKAMFTEQELIIPEGDRTLAQGRDTQIILHLMINETALEVVVQCSIQYPLHAKPSVLLRCSGQDITKLNNNLRLFLDDAPLGEPLIMSVVQWLQDNFEDCVVNEILQINENRKESPSDNGTEEVGSAVDEDVFARYWIYSHHLRSNIKRRDIETIAKSLELNGFSSPGKPGIIVVEGNERDCQEFWEKVKSWNWKHIVMRHKEESKNSEGFLCLDKFIEMVFASNDGKRMELAELRKYLERFGLEYGFKILLNM